MNTTWKVILAAMVVLSTVMVEGSRAEEQELTLKEVPKVVKKAARKAVPGIKFTEAEMETKGDTIVYELEGIADGKEYELLISAKGKVLKKEVDDDEGHGCEKNGDGDDHDDDDDDHDDDDHDGHNDDHDGHDDDHDGHDDDDD